MEKYPPGNGGQTLPLPKTNTLEILAELDLQTAKSIGLTIKGGAQDAAPILIQFTDSELQVMDAKAPLTVAKDGRLRLRIFIDRSVLEVFANETVGLTKIISPLGDTPTLELHAEGGPARAKRIQAWPLKTIW